MGRGTSEAVIALEGDDGIVRKLARLVAFRDGSCGFLVPYSPYKAGLVGMVRVPVTFAATGRGPLEFERALHTSERLKLSVHISGFVQFSGTGSSFPSGVGRFVVPKGIGIQSQSLLDAPGTGPTFGAFIFDLKSHAPLEKAEKAPVLLFDRAAISRRDEPQVRAHGYHSYLVEVFALPVSELRNAQLINGDVVLVRPYSSIRPETSVALKVLQTPSSLVLYGVMISLRHAYEPHETRPRGFMISGPKDLTRTRTIMGLWPPGLVDSVVLQDPNII